MVMRAVALNTMHTLIIKWLSRRKAGRSGQDNRLVLGFAKVAIVILLLLVLIVVAAFQMFDTCPWLLKVRVGVSRAKFDFGIDARTYLKGIYTDCDKVGNEPEYVLPLHLEIAEGNGGGKGEGADIAEQKPLVVEKSSAPTYKNYNVLVKVKNFFLKLLRCLV